MFPAFAAATEKGKGKGKGKAMASTTSSIIVMLVFIASVGVYSTEAAVYKVGDAVGWTILGNPNYTAWVMSKDFILGDTLVFEYNNNFHNVLVVSKADYKACNAASPIAAYTSGNGSIVLKRRGHHFFICGVPGHCGAGQKVDIRIAKLASSSVSPTASPLPPTGGVVSSPAAAPRPNSAPAAAAAPTALAAAFALAALLHVVALSLDLVVSF